MEGKDHTRLPPIYLVSGGVGASGEQLVNTVLAQFPDRQVPVVMVPRVRQTQQIEEVVAQAVESGGTIVHTLVDADLRQTLIHLAGEKRVANIDLMGDLLSRLTQVLDQSPLGHPGLYRQQHRADLERVAAIHYSIDHDDGKHPEGWQEAEIVLVGVSRVGKTPLSMYLSVMGWKVANVPFVMGLPLPHRLFELDLRRVIGLIVESGQLLIYRQQRQSRLGAPGPSDYIEPAKIYEELQAARRLFRRKGFPIIDVTDKPIESIAEEVIARVTRRLHREAHKP